MPPFYHQNSSIMKKRIVFSYIILSTLWIAGCTSDDSSENTGNLDAMVQEITDMVVSGSWIVTSFIDSGVDETDDFSGYVFTFNANGSLTASNGTNTIEGSWSITSDDSSDDSPDDDFDDVDFNIFFASPDSFSELTEDWEIVSSSDSRIDLIHISGGDGDTDTLTLVRN